MAWLPNVADFCLLQTLYFKEHLLLSKTGVFLSPSLTASCCLLLQLTVSTTSIAWLQMSMDYFQALVLWHHLADWFRQCNWISKCLIRCHARLIQYLEKRPQLKDECRGVGGTVFFSFCFFTSHYTKEKLGLGFAPSLTFWLTVTNPLGSVTLWLGRKDCHEKVLVLLMASKGYNLMFSIREH